MATIRTATGSAIDRALLAAVLLAGDLLAADLLAGDLLAEVLLAEKGDIIFQPLTGAQGSIAAARR
jgi:hypothetical protein